MPQLINTNIASLNAQRNLNSSQTSLASSLQRLSSGLRINSAKDDAAGLAISERFTAQIRGLNQAQRNANDGISLAQTAEGALVEVGASLQRTRELAVQSANATNSADDRANLNLEVQQMIAEIDRISSQTEFNGSKILNVSGGFTATFQVGANANQVISTTVDNVSTSNIGTKTNYTTITGYSADSSFAHALGNQSVVAFSTSKVNNVAVTDVLAGNTAAEKVNAINNASATSGVSAFSYGNSLVGTGSAVSQMASGSMAANEVTVNGVAIGAAADSATSSMVAAINAKSSSTGVEAYYDTGNGKMVFYNASYGSAAGITVSVTDSDVAATLGVANGTNSVSAGQNGLIVLTTDLTFGASVTTTSISAGGIGGDTSSVNIAVNAADIKTQNVSSVSAANLTIIAVDKALGTVNSLRARLGAVQNRLESTISSLQTTSENMSSSRSRIRDADFAAETANLTRAQILQQAGVAMLAQANQVPNNVLTLLR
ncbi:MAG: flagellin [Pseudomonadota bacterium]